MVKAIEKKYLIISIAGFIIILLTLTGGLIFGPFNHILPESLRKKLGYTLESGTEITVRLIIDYNGELENFNETIFFLENQTATAYSILEVANITVIITANQDDIFVEAINGIEQNVTHYWWYLIDGIDGGIASNRFDLRSNNVEVVTWVFRTAQGLNI
jgi:hypothetical protein